LSEHLWAMKMTPAEFARRMKVGRSTVSRWITGEREMSYESAVAASRILGVHAEDMYYWIELSDKPSD
jgi:plasmid maintenance system antidote protein VapI